MVKAIVGLLSALAMLVGIIFILTSVTLPGRYTLNEASAMQATQVYAMAQHYTLLGIASFAFATLLVVMYGLGRD